MAKFKQIELQDAYDDAPRPVAAMAKSFADGAHTTVHRHGRGTVELDDMSSATELLETVEPIDGLARVATAVGSGGGDRDTEPSRAATADFVLEGLCALKKISRNDDGRLFATSSGDRRTGDRERERAIESLMDEDEAPAKGSKKKYYN